MKRKKIYTTPSASCTLLKADNPLLTNSKVNTGSGTNAGFTTVTTNENDPNGTTNGNVPSNPFDSLFD